MSMNPTEIAAAAAMLAAARAEGRKLPAPPNPAPATVEEAYGLQDALIAATDSPVVGWKIGATSARAQTMLGVDGPFIGPVFERWVTESPAAVATPEGAVRIVEPEFAVRMAAGLPARSAPYSAEEIAGAVGALLPAFEVIDVRIARPPEAASPFAAGPFWTIADAGANGALVLGPEATDWRALDLDALSVSVAVDGAAKTEGVSTNALGGTLKALAWAVEHLRARGIGLEAGAVVTTGVVTEIFTLEPGQTVDADYGPLGSLSLEMAGY